MLTFSVNDNNDLFIDNTGMLSISKDLQAMSYIYKNKSLVRKGEIYYNTDEGIDFLNNIFEGIPDIGIFQDELLTQLKNTDDTIEVNNYTYNIFTQNNKQIYNYSVNLNTPYGVIQLNG